MTKEMRQEVSRFLKKYFLASFFIIFSLMLIHYPNEFFYGDTIDFLILTIDLGNWGRLLLFFAGVFTYSLIFMPFLLFSKVKYIGWIPLAIFSIFTGLEKYIFYLQGNHTPWNIAFNEDMLINFMVNPTGIQDSLETYGGDYHFSLYLFIFPLVLFIILKYISNRLPVMKKNELYMPIKTIVFILIIITPSFFPSSVYVPYMFRVQTTIFDKIVDTIFEMTGIDRLPVAYAPVKKDTPQNIVMIMDESIRGDLISINNPDEEAVMKATPYLYSLKNDIINFGNLYSTANCSYPSNELLMIGFNVNKFKTIPNYFITTPTIFQYMKKAGYNTYFVDNVHNGLYMVFKIYDRKYVDHLVNDFPRYQKILSYERDFYTLDEVKKILNNGKKNFIYILKYGEHFPYKNSFDNKNPLFKDWGIKNPQQEFNLYMNGIQNNVDNYFKKLIKVVGDTDTVVLYQSDHSVNITRHKDKDRIIISHCEAGLTGWKEMQSIPGILYSPNKKWYKGYHNLKHGYSASHMMPTLLDFAGYDEKDYSEEYGHSFKNPETDIYIRNMSGMFYIGDKNTSNIYNHVELDVMSQIHPLNKRRVLPNTLPNRDFIIDKETAEKEDGE